MNFHWRDGNRLELLENGEEFFPAVFAAIRAAKKEVLLETFIFFKDKVGEELQQALIEAAGNGASVDVTVDGYGSADLDGDFVAAMTAVGVRIHMFDPGKRLLGRRINVFRRMHLKIVVVDGELAFIGGINFSADHLGDFGPAAKQDYAMQVEGPVVHDIHRFALSTIAPVQPARRHWWQRRRRVHSNGFVGVNRGEARALFVTRDNDAHRNDIEQHYLHAIRDARSRLVIANAYFFPGYRVLREIRNAARRGVRVRLILQGQPDMPIAKWGMEQNVRDARISMLYEGTTGIQALDLLGRKVLMTQGEALKSFTKIVHKFCQNQEGNEAIKEFVTPLNQLNKEWGELTMKIGMAAMKDREMVGAASVDYCMYSGYACLAYFWADMARVAAEKLAEGTSEEAFYKAKLQTARFYFQRILPRTRMHVDAMLSGADNLMQMAEEDFALGY